MNTDIDYQVNRWELKLKQQPAFNPGQYGIPKKYHASSFENFTGNDKLVETLRGYSGGGLVLSGKTGSGKTHLSVAIMRNLEAMEWQKHCQHNIDLVRAGQPASTELRSTKAFITAPELLLGIRKSFRDDSECSESDILDRYSGKSLMVLDDLGSEKTTEYAITTLYILIDRRDRQLRDTIITTNLSLAEIETKLNARIASRLAGWVNVKIGMSDYRKRK